MHILVDAYVALRCNVTSATIRLLVPHSFMAFSTCRSAPTLLTRKLCRWAVPQKQFLLTTDEANAPVRSSSWSHHLQKGKIRSRECGL